jgi:hypothetical protein
MIVLACHERADADRALGAGPVLHDDRLVPLLAKRVGENSRRGVVGASRRKGHDQLDLPFGPISARGHRCGKGHDESRKTHERAQPGEFSKGGATSSP